MPTLIDRELYPEESGSGRRPNTFSVLIVLLVTAVVISYLVGYALPQALIMADALQPWPPYDDPRRRWMALSLFTILASYMGLWGFFRLLGAAQFRRIDAMAQD
jgi:hypothetical protein